jgi:rare lipoprotein A (peptidoglycan hydrolase)
MIFDLPAGQTELMFAVFGDKELIGNASWYVHPRYAGELIAASTDFAMDTKLKVIAVNSGKEVIVTVKDYGPDKTVHPDRVVDLSKEAFSVLAPTGAGVIKVKVLPAD